MKTASLERIRRKSRSLKRPDQGRRGSGRGGWGVAVVAGVVMSVGAGLLGCGDARRDPPKTQQPFVPQNEQVALGQKVFMTHCYQCHPGGSGGLGPAINDKPLPENLIKLQVRQGLGAMPAFDQRRIPDEELDAIPAYLKALRAQR
jgi:mono/diheme cytochrome c family protein